MKLNKEQHDAIEQLSKKIDDNCFTIIDVEELITIVLLNDEI